VLLPENEARAGKVRGKWGCCMRHISDDGLKIGYESSTAVSYNQSLRTSKKYFGRFRKSKEVSKLQVQLYVSSQGEERHAGLERTLDQSFELFKLDNWSSSLNEFYQCPSREVHDYSMAFLGIS
jgi:hypothetical protein